MSQKGAKKKTVLLVYTSLSSFVNNDYLIISSAHSVQKYHYSPVRGILKNAFQICKQFFFLLIFGWKFDLFYCWFADYHSFLPVLFAKIFRKKAVVVIGGYDICREKSLNYGAFCSPFRSFFSAQSIRHCTINLTVSRYVDRKVGFVFPKINHQLIYNCIFLPSPDENTGSKEKIILCVAIVQSQRTYRRKGIDTFIELSIRVPEYRFVLIGPSHESLMLFPHPLPKNVTVIEQLPHKDLIDFFKKASIYCQLSRVEIFGVAIGEAMQYRCIPIVTNVGGMPEVVGSNGFVVPRDIEKIAEIIYDLDRQETAERREACSQQILTHFSFAQRQDLLLSTIERIMG